MLERYGKSDVYSASCFFMDELYVCMKQPTIIVWQLLKWFAPG